MALIFGSRHSPPVSPRYSYRSSSASPSFPTSSPALSHTTNQTAPPAVTTPNPSLNHVPTHPRRPYNVPVDQINCFLRKIEETIPTSFCGGPAYPVLRLTGVPPSAVAVVQRHIDYLALGLISVAKISK